MSTLLQQRRVSERGRAAVTLLGVLVLAIVGVLIVVGLRMSDIARELLLDVGPKATGTSWTLGGLDIVLLAGHGSVDDLVIGNPTPFEADHAIRFEHATLDVALGSLFDDVLVIEEVNIDGGELIYEQSGLSRSNLQTLVDNVRRYTSGEASSAGETDDSRAFRIERLSFTRGRVKVRSGLLGERDVEVPPVIVTDIGGHTGREAVANALERILAPVVAEAIEAARAAALESGKKKLREAVDEALDDVLGEPDAPP